jgi:hypothetical protein
MERWRYTDQDGEVMTIKPSQFESATAVLEDHGGIHVPAHRLAEVVTALYQAAGQDVPDLPVIHDEAQVCLLATLLCESRNRSVPHRSDKDDARYLLAHGVTLPEVK